MKNCLFVLVVILISVSNGLGQERTEDVSWKLVIDELKPGVADCDDVMRVLNLSECPSSLLFKKFDHFELNLLMEDRTGVRDDEIGLVRSLVLFFEPPFVPFDELDISLKEFERIEVYDLPGTFYFRNKALGIAIEFEDSNECARIRTMSLSVPRPD